MIVSPLPALMIVLSKMPPPPVTVPFVVPLPPVMLELPLLSISVQPLVEPVMTSPVPLPNEKRLPLPPLTVSELPMLFTSSSPEPPVMESLLPASMCAWPLPPVIVVPPADASTQVVAAPSVMTSPLPARMLVL